MKMQANRNYSSNDIVMTPPDICKAIVEHFRPTGIVMDPCAGTGNFIHAFKNYGCNIDVDVNNILACEINTDLVQNNYSIIYNNFFDYNGYVDWIITNPPWSGIKLFLEHAMEVADNVVLLFTINHLWTKARMRMVYARGFIIREICVFNAPKELNASGFTVGCVHLTRTNMSYPLKCIPDIRFSQLKGYELL